MINGLDYKLCKHPTSGLNETTGALVDEATNVSDTVFTDTNLLDGGIITVFLCETHSHSTGIS